MFGSVPLKTYLPDGDIDLTAFSTGTVAVSEAAVLEVQAALERAEKDADSPFQVTDVQFIQAEVSGAGRSGVSELPYMQWHKPYNIRQWSSSNASGTRAWGQVALVGTERGTYFPFQVTVVAYL